MKIRSAFHAGLLTLTFFGFALPPPAPAYAAKAGKAAAQKKSVTLGAIQGQKGDTRKTVIQALEKDFTVTDADGLEAPGKDAEVAQLAKDLGSDAIIFGKLEKNKLTLVVRSAADGKVLGEVELQGAGAKLKKAIQKDASTGVGGLLGGGGAAAEDEEEEEEAPKKPKKPPVEDEEDEEDAEDAEDAEDEGGPDGEGEEGEEEGGGDEGDDEGGGDEGGGDEGGDDEKPSEPSGLPSVLLTLGIKGISRKFDYKDRLADIRPNMGFADPAKYSVVSPAVMLRLELYPIALFGGGSGSFLENLGLQGMLEYGLPTKSAYAEPAATVTPTPRTTELENRTQDFWVGPRLRLGLGETTTVGFTVAYGQHKFYLVGDEGGIDPTTMLDIWPPPLVPDVKYGYIRVAADASFDFGKLMAGLNVGVRKLLSYGELDTVWFPGVTGNAFEAGLLVGYHLTPMFTAVGGFELLRYGFDLNGIPDNNRIVAGGALDTYISFWAGIRMRLPGSTSGSFSASTE